ncbi:MAG: family 1 glycosylhydrolase [Candidatus Giovannonibacteria bacterium]|nr:family 1 glycosylhydrolase [Candidatus Giovannonibacteria bacterium]
MKYEFPKNFFWGAAASAYQVEGGNHNDWTEWEKATGHEESGRACDHYNRFREDFDIAKSLGHNAHRFSIEWSRIEPEEGKWDEKEIRHYQEVIDALRERGIEPFVTLWHWTLPIWVAKQGGWENKKTIDDFARYVDKIVRSVKGHY